LFELPCCQFACCRLPLKLRLLLTLPAKSRLPIIAARLSAIVECLEEAAATVVSRAPIGFMMLIRLFATAEVACRSAEVLITLTWLLAVSKTLTCAVGSMVLTVDDVACALCRDDGMIGEAIVSRLTRGDAALRSTDMSGRARAKELLPPESPLVTAGALFRSMRAAGALLTRAELKLSDREKPDDPRIWLFDGAD